MDLFPFGLAVTGLRERLGASPDLNTLEARAKVRLMKGAKKMPDIANPVLESPRLMKSPTESLVHESCEEFFDTTTVDDLDEEDKDNEGEENGIVSKLQAVGANCRLSWDVVLGRPAKKIPATRGSQDLDWNAPSVELDPNMFYSSLRRTISDGDCNGWSDPGGKGFMVRSRTYNVDSLKVCSTPLTLPLMMMRMQPGCSSSFVNSNNIEPRGWWSDIWWGDAFEAVGRGLAEVRSKDGPYCFAT